MSKYLLFIFMVAVTLHGCTPIGNDTIDDPTTTPAGAASVDGPTISPIRATAAPASTATAVPPQPTNEVATATAAVPTLTEAEPSPAICSSPPQQFDIPEALAINIIRFRFESENLLTFEGWTPGPEPVVRPVKPEPTPDMWPEPSVFTPRLLTGGQLTLPEGQISPRILDMGDLLNNPCSEDCLLEIISQSPNREWQLVQVQGWLVDVRGIWLVGKSEMVRLIPYTTHLEWQWATDSSLLWIVYNDPELGGHTLVAQLDNPAVVRRTGPITEDLPYLLDPWYYRVAFSPIDKVGISTTSFEFPGYDTDELFIIDLNDTFTVTDSSRVIPGIVTVSWNEATQDFLLEVVKENRVEIQDLSGNTLLIIPRRILEIFRSLPIPDEEPLDPLEPYFRIGNYALSPSGEKLAVQTRSAFLLFECERAFAP